MTCDLYLVNLVLLFIGRGVFVRNSLVKKNIRDEVFLKNYIVSNEAMKKNILSQEGRKKNPGPGACGKNISARKKIFQDEAVLKKKSGTGGRIHTPPPVYQMIHP